MAQYAWVLEVRPGYEEEYGRRHEEIRPEMTEAPKEAGIRNYTIFRHGLTLFGFFETDDIEKTQADLLAKSAKHGCRYAESNQRNPTKPRRSYVRQPGGMRASPRGRGSA